MPSVVLLVVSCYKQRLHVQKYFTAQWLWLAGWLWFTDYIICYVCALEYLGIWGTLFPLSFHVSSALYRLVYRFFVLFTVCCLLLAICRKQYGYVNVQYFICQNRSLLIAHQLYDIFIILFSTLQSFYHSPVFHSSIISSVCH